MITRITIVVFLSFLLYLFCTLIGNSGIFFLIPILYFGYHFLFGSLQYNFLLMYLFAQVTKDDKGIIQTVQYLELKILYSYNSRLNEYYYRFVEGTALQTRFHTCKAKNLQTNFPALCVIGLTKYKEFIQQKYPY